MRGLSAVLAASALLLAPNPDLRAAVDAGAGASLTGAVGQAQWSDVPRVIVFGDVHGAHAELLDLLRDTGVIDAQQRWAAGTAHVVSLGDLLDRGAGSRAVMDLLMRLQQEALAAGGRLHVVLGNHEAMNLLGDLRYVEAGEYAAYEDLEPPGAREEARAAWQARTCEGPCPDFDRQFPPGYFGHRIALSPGGPYGSWLLAQPVVIRINETLYMHGGPGPALRGLGIAEVNRNYRDALLATLRGGDEAPAAPLLEDGGPNWYRGTALCREVTEWDQLRPLLEQLGASRLVIGHTPTRNARIVSRFEARVFKADTGMNRAAYRGRPAALLIGEGEPAAHYAGEAAPVPVMPEPLFVAPGGIGDERVHKALRLGTLTVAGRSASGETVVEVEHEGVRFAAALRALAPAQIRRELAAVALDRLLGLGVVPAAVEREVGGRRGLLQARPLRWSTQAALERSGQRLQGACDAQEQFMLVAVLDVLAGNGQRTAESILRDAADGLLLGVGFEEAFGRRVALPAYLREAAPAPGEELRRRLAALDEATLAKVLGPLLDERARQAILARRDLLLRSQQRTAGQVPDAA